MDHSTSSALLVLAVVGFVMMSLFALWLQFRQWQMQRLFKMMFTLPVDSVQGKSGIFTVMWIVLFIIIIGLLVSG